MASLATVGGESEAAEPGLEQDESCFSQVEEERRFHVQNWKIKADQAKKAEFFREAEKLKNQIAHLEKDKNGHLYNKKSDFRTEYSTLEEYEQKLANNRKAEKIKTEQQLSKIHNNVKRLQRQLKDVKPTPEFVEKLREMMEEVDSAIIAFKEEQRVIYEELMKEEKSTSIELTALEKKIEASLSTAPEKVFRAPPGKVLADTIISHQLPEEVMAFEKFLQQTGGRLGGWDDFDHQSFLKVWTKHKGKPAYLEEAMAYLPSRTREDVQQHEKWYQEFLFLEEKKKEAIQKWKAKKQLEKHEISKLQEKMEDESDRQQKEAAQKQKLEEERRKRQQELEAWKKKKEIEVAAKLEMRLKEEKEQQKKQRKERQRQLEVKLLVEEHTRLKKEQEEFLRLEKEMKEEAEIEERKKMALYEIYRFQERDQQKLEEKAREKRAKEEAEAEKEKRLALLKEKVEVHVERDPSRLCKLTKGWEERCREIGPTGSAPLLHIPHRAVPTWRQGL
ncbi:coiled-coil domain-containing protein 112 [Spea bombifrons]|uniref:coiled-coil domain-containing protein 112 n=1 Tax=Spea bombifrons TaxID=233779 RepID=UPI00234ABABB|nr:coiled-coil domain-containing protein 112 [Spea bombifrons]